MYVPPMSRGTGNSFMSLDALSERELGAWRELARRALDPNPFYEPEFVLAATRHLRDRVRLLTHRRDGDWLACLPIGLPGTRGLPRLVVSWKHRYCFLGTPLLDGQRPAEAARGLLDSAMGDSRGLPLILRGIGDGPALDALTAEGRARGLETVFSARRERAVLRRRSDGGYLDGMRPRRRRELARQRRRLAEHLGADVAVRDRAGELNAVEEFLQLESAGWKGDGRGAMASSRRDAALFRDICGGFARAGRLQLLSLDAGGPAAAMKCNLAAGDLLCCFKIAHDEALGRFSPGVQLEVENVELFHHRRELLMDSCAEDHNAMINRLWPDRRAVTTLALGRPGARNELFRRGLRTAHALRTRERGKPSTRQ